MRHPITQIRLAFGAIASRARSLGWRGLPAFLLALILVAGLEIRPAVSQSSPPAGNWSEQIVRFEKTWERQYETYFEGDLADITLGGDDIPRVLSQLARETGTRPAVLWVVPQPEFLMLALAMPGRPAAGRVIPEVTRDEMWAVARQFYRELTTPALLQTRSYLEPARQLYEWIVAPVDGELQAEKIDTLLLCLGPGLRALPIAAFHDGERFLVEKYSLARIPAFNLFDRDSGPLGDARVLAMGASEFEDLNPLPAVPVEISAIVGPGAETGSGSDRPPPWPGKAFLNGEFTLENLKREVASGSFAIVHLATHAEFRSGQPDNSYIQLWDARLGLDRIGEVGWPGAATELLVLSACQTAVGDKDAELGFAGLALQSGVKSAIASLWSVSDEGTLALMGDFYRQLRRVPVRAEALRRTQMAMIRGEVRLEGGELLMSRGEVALPPNLAEMGDRDLSHPFYWAGFTTIGNPW
jgi:CHAT domain-containing protein